MSREDTEKKFIPYEYIKRHAYYEDAEARQYVCKGCGMKLITDDHTFISECFFCGGLLELGDSLSEELRPTKVIPFQISKRKAEKAFKRWFFKLKLSPREFQIRRKDCKIQAVYIPVWTFQMRAQGEAVLHAVKSSKKIEEREKIIETEHYDLLRQFDLGFSNLFINASKHFETRFLDAAAPYDFTKVKRFSPREIAGYVAEKYYYTENDLMEEAEKKTRESLREYILSTVQGYDECRFLESEYQIAPAEAEYTWLPVYYAGLSDVDSDYTFFMNGQTGKLAFSPPYSLIKTFVGGGVILAFAFFALRIIILFLGGPLL